MRPELKEEIYRLLEQSLQVTSKVERPASRSMCYNAIGEAYLKSGNKSRSLEILAESVKNSDLIKKPDEKARQLAWAARIIVQAGDQVKAVSQFERARLLARASEKPADAIYALYQVACEYAEANLNTQAVEISGELHTLVTNPENEVDTASELINIAELYFETGQETAAEQVLGEALLLASENKDLWFKIERLIEIVWVYIKAGQPEKADKLLPDISAGLNQIEESGRTHFLLELADVLIESGQKTRAEEVLSDAVRIIRQHEIAFSRSRGLIETASRYLQTDRVDIAVELLVESETVSSGIENVNDKVSVLCEIGSLMGEAGQKEKALNIAHQAWTLSETVKNRNSIPFVMGSVAVLFSELQDRELAAAVVSHIIQSVQELHAKTSGLGRIVEDLLETGETTLAVQLAEIIREPEVKTLALTSVAESLIKAG